MTTTTTKLDHILAQTRLSVARRKAAADLSALELRVAAHTPRGFAAGLRQVADHGPAVIAELKKASPSKGLIRADFQPAWLATVLEAAGAAALSVLTDEEFFQGSLGNLEAASAAVGIPCLRKDFIVDPFQILEARASGADAILLIVAAHTDEQLRLLRKAAREFGLDVLCEVHDGEELTRAIELDCEAVGVNSRDLRDFTLRPETLQELAERIPAAVVRVAESGIASHEDMMALRVAGYQAFLVGEALMRLPHPGLGLAKMLGRTVRSRTRAARTTNSSTPKDRSDTWVKICGNTNLRDALLAAELGADAVGFVFAPSVRQMTAAQVAKITPYLPEDVECVGVFPAWSAEEILAAVRESGVTTAQLHGTPDPELARKLHDNFAGNLRIIHVLNWSEEMDEETFLDIARKIVLVRRADRVLIDAKVGAALGGTGTSFDWRAAQGVFAKQRVSLELIVAGGLRPENVEEAIDLLRPWGVDVVSGVEASAGRKDPEKLALFIERAKASVEGEEALREEPQIASGR